MDVSIIYPKHALDVLKLAISVTFPAICGGLLLLRLVVKLRAGRCRSKRDMSGKTVIVTGANAGIGLETARDLARRKARVILCCRSKERGEEAAKDVRDTTGNQNVLCKICDLSSLKSVRNFADDILQNEERLDVLINNAAMVPPDGKRYLTEDGVEVQFASNHLGHFLLTNLLLPLLKKSAPSRIVVVSSLLYTLGTIDFENLNLENKLMGGLANYCNIKLANILFAKELSRRLKGTGVTVNALHPGIIHTGINKNCPWYFKHLLCNTIYRFNKTPQEGAQTSIYLAVSEEVEGTTGKFFTDCAEKKLLAKAKDEKVAKKLWNACERMAGITNECQNGVIPVS